MRSPSLAPVRPRGASRTIVRSLLTGFLDLRQLAVLLSRAGLQRAVAHLAAWAPYLYGLAKWLASGWVATSDNGVIALRSLDVLTTHGPLVGQATRLGSGVFDLGPLEYWLLTLPAHMDAAHGVLWGATLWCLVAASLIVEAAWAVGGVFPALAASAVVLGVAAWIAAVTMLPCWNPWLGLVFFIAALAAGWAVMSGRCGWFAAAVVTASIARQTHLMFAIAAAAVVVLAFAVGLADTLRARKRAGQRLGSARLRRRVGYWFAGYRWAVVGIFVGIACWAAPLVQQFTANPGNMTALFSPQGPPLPRTSVNFGLEAISAAAQPPAYWWQRMDSLGKLSNVWGRPALGGAIALAIIVLSLVAATGWLRSRRAAGLAYRGGLVSAIAAGGLVVAAILAGPIGNTEALAELVTMTTMKKVDCVTERIEHKIPPQQVALKVVAANNRYRRQLTLGVAYALRADGYWPMVSEGWGLQLGDGYSFRGEQIPLAEVWMRTLFVKVVKRPPSRHLG